MEIGIEHVLDAQYDSLEHRALDVAQRTRAGEADPDLAGVDRVRNGD